VSIVHLNGRYLPREEALVHVDDRGFLFADGVYEVTPAYRGRFFLMERHRDRLLKGLCALRIDADVSHFEEIHARLLRENGLVEAPSSVVYLQITRGVAPRTHAFPREPVAPTVYAFAKEYVRPAKELWERGYEAVTVPDRRWSRADVKSISLLPNVLAQQAAVDAGVTDALMVRDGMALEGAHNNFFAVFGEALVTHPLSNVVLPGITRTYLVEMARELGIEVQERPIQLEELQWATESFFTGTTTEIRPTVRIDGRPVGDGGVGPVTRRLADEFRARTDACAAGAA
jgi:D-alanine transaminase